MSENQNDRVSYSFGMKLSLPEKYESGDFHINLSSDVKDGETVEQAFTRVVTSVELEATKKFNELRAKGYEVLQVNGKTTPTVQAPKVVISKATQDMIKQAFLTMQTRNGLTTETFKTKFLSGRGLSTVPESEYDSIYAAINKYLKETK